MTTTNNTSPTEFGIAAERPGMLARSIILMKPVTWFPPTWAFLCGAIASGVTVWSLDDGWRIFIGMLMAGPILCGMSQVLNDYFDREVDAINEPDRLIPSGQVSMRQVLITIVVLVLLGFAIAIYLGRGISLLVAAGFALAIVYSAPPLRAKQNGWYGNAVAAISYEGLAWLAGHLAFAMLTPQSVLFAVLFSLGTHGIMAINDYKSIDGDTQVGILTIPVQLGPHKAAWFIAGIMDVAQLGVILAFAAWGLWLPALVIGGLLIAQIPLQWMFIRQPLEKYLIFSAFGVLIFVLSMLIAAIGLRAL